MKMPLILWVAVWAMGLPIAIAVVRRQLGEPGKAAVVLWLLSMLFQTIGERLWTLLVDNTNNLFFGVAFLPLEAAAVLMAVAHWQVRPIARTTVRLFIPLYAIVWALALWRVEDVRGYSVVAAPVLGLLVLASALYALVTRAQQDDEPILRSEWGWILTGIAIHFATDVGYHITGQIGLLHDDMPLLMRISIWKAWISTFALLFISWGFLCPVSAGSSASSSSPAPPR